MKGKKKEDIEKEIEQRIEMKNKQSLKKINKD